MMVYGQRNGVPLVYRMDCDKVSLQRDIRPPEVSQCCKSRHTAAVSQTSLVVQHMKVKTDCPHLLI